MTQRRPRKGDFRELKSKQFPVRACPPPKPSKGLPLRCSFWKSVHIYPRLPRRRSYLRGRLHLSYNLGQNKWKTLTPLPAKSKMGKWRVLAFARLHPWFGGGGGIGVCCSIFLSKIVDPRLFTWGGKLIRRSWRYEVKLPVALPFSLLVYFCLCSSRQWVLINKSTL